MSKCVACGFDVDKFDAMHGRLCRRAAALEENFEQFLGRVMLRWSTNPPPVLGAYLWRGRVSASKPWDQPEWEDIDETKIGTINEDPDGQWCGPLLIDDPS